MQERKEAVECPRSEAEQYLDGLYKKYSDYDLENKAAALVHTNYVEICQFIRQVILRAIEKDPSDLGFLDDAFKCREQGEEVLEQCKKERMDLMDRYKSGIANLEVKRGEEMKALEEEKWLIEEPLRKLEEKHYQFRSTLEETLQEAERQLKEKGHSELVVCDRVHYYRGRYYNDLLIEKKQLMETLMETLKPRLDEWNTKVIKLGQKYSNLIAEYKKQYFDEIATARFRIATREFLALEQFTLGVLLCPTKVLIWRLSNFYQALWGQNDEEQKIYQSESEALLSVKEKDRFGRPIFVPIEMYRDWLLRREKHNRTGKVSLVESSLFTRVSCVPEVKQVKGVGAGCSAS